MSLSLGQSCGDSISESVDGIRDGLTEVRECSRSGLELGEHHASLLSCEVSQALENGSNDLLLVCLELLLRKKHGGHDLVGGADHTALVGGGVLHDWELALVEQSLASCSSEEHVGALDDNLGRWLAVWLQELSPVGLVNGSRTSASRDEGISHKAVVHGVACAGALLGVGEVELALIAELGGVVVVDIKAFMELHFPR